LHTASVLLATLAYAQTATITSAPTATIVDLFLGSKRSANFSFDGSIITSDTTATTYEVQCKSGALNLPGFPTTTCDLKDPPWTVINGPSIMIGVLSTAIDTVTALLAETCRLVDQTAAYCNYTFIESLGSATTSTSYQTTITGDQYVKYPVTITAGLNALPPATITSTTNATQTFQPSPISTNGSGSIGLRFGFFEAGILAVMIGMIGASC